MKEIVDSDIALILTHGFVIRMTGPTTETHSRDDESAEMDRVRARLRQDQPRLSTSPWGESNLSLSDTSDSSEGSQSRTTTKSLKAPPSSCFTANANQSSKDQGTSSKQQPLLKERQNLQGRSLQTRLDDDTFSSLVQGPAGENPKRECASPFVPSKAILRDESDSDEYHSFLDDCEDLDELDRQIEASIQAKAGTNPIPRLDLHAPVGRLKQPLRLNSGRELEPLTHLVELNYHDSLLLDDEVLDELDRKVEARLKASPPSNDFLFKTSTVDRPKSCGRSQSVICHSRNAKSVEGEMKVSSMKISHDRVYADIAQDRHDYGRPSETDTDVERNQRLSSKRKLVDQYKVNVTSGYTPKKRKQVPRSTSQPNHQRQSEKRPKRKEKASSVSKQLSTLQPSRRPLRGGQTAKTVEAIHRLTIEGTEMTDTSSEDSFAFFNESEINKIEERVRAEQRKRQPSIPSPLKAVVKPIEVDSTGNENAHRGSPGHEGNLDTDVASPPQHSTSSRRSDRDENDFDRAFGFKDDANIQKRSNRRACDDFGFSCQNNVASSLEKQQHYHDCSNFHGIETDERMSEIEPKLYAPTPSEKRPPPIVHRFSLENRPLGARRGLPVEQVYPWPIGLLWRTKFSAFNQMQSELANVIAYSDDNIVVSAPTGAGKTALFEMAMARFFSLNLQRQTRALNDHQQVDNSQKIVYVSPSKALCDERYEDWSTRLASMNLGIQVALITGDGDPSASYRDLAHANLVLTTPEKWDSLTRRWTENFFLFASVKLFLVDEVHLVADDSRGWCLESIVCRMKTIQKAARQILVTQTELQHSR